MMVTKEFLLEQFESLNIKIDYEYMHKYLDFILSAKEVKQKIGGGDKHHILPNKLFPHYRLKSRARWNQKKISFEDHYICHFYLTKALPENEKMLTAFFLMTHKSIPEKITDDILKSYAEIRQKYCELSSINNTGEKHPMYGQKHTEEARAKISARHKGTKFTDDHKEKIAEHHRGRKRSEETRERMRKAHPMYKSPLITEEGMTVWKRADEIYLLWLENNKPSYIRLGKLDGYPKYTGAHKTMREHFSKGWNPLEDEEFFKWKEQKA